MVDLFSLYLQFTGFDLKRAKLEINSLNKLSAQELQQWQEKKKWETVKTHFENNPFYRKLLGGNMPDSWDKLPVLRKSDFQQPLELLISDKYKKSELFVSNTSGSTGTPFYFAKNKYAHAVAWASIQILYQEAGIAPTDVQARFFGIPLSGWSNYKENAKDLLMRRIRFPVFQLNDSTLEKYCQKIFNGKVNYIYGYTNSIKHFAKYVSGKYMPLNAKCPTLKAAIVTSEMCTVDEQNFIASALGVPVYKEYGASEVGIIAFEKNSIYKVLDASVYVENNDKNELLITSLFNDAFPLIRYNIGDIGTIERRTDGTFIKEILGRSDDMVHLPNGNVAAGLTLYYCSRAILEQQSTIKEIYVTQKTLSKFVIYYISDAVLTEQQIGIVRQAFNTYLQPGLELVFEKQDQIRRRKSGKFQIFTSEIN
jgi:phenylacetate-CoA ligase